MDISDFAKQFIASQERIASALEAIVANGGGGFVASTTTAAKDKPAEKTKPAEKHAEKPAEKAPEPEVPSEPEITVDVVRSALKEYRMIEGTPAMMEILKIHGGGKETLADIAPSCFPAIMKAINEAG